MSSTSENPRTKKNFTSPSQVLAVAFAGFLRARSNLAAQEAVHTGHKEPGESQPDMGQRARGVGTGASPMTALLADRRIVTSAVLKWAALISGTLPGCRVAQASCPQIRSEAGVDTGRCKQILTCLLISNGTHQQQAPSLAALNAISAPWTYQQDSHCRCISCVNGAATEHRAHD